MHEREDSARLASRYMPSIKAGTFFQRLLHRSGLNKTLTELLVLLVFWGPEIKRSSLARCACRETLVAAAAAAAAARVPTARDTEDKGASVPL